jgi:hypothetical protein
MSFRFNEVHILIPEGSSNVSRVVGLFSAHTIPLFPSNRSLFLALWVVVILEFSLSGLCRSSSSSIAASPFSRSSAVNFV